MQGLIQREIFMQNHADHRVGEYAGSDSERNIYAKYPAGKAGSSPQ